MRSASTAGLILLTSIGCFGQPDVQREFEAASIKASRPGDIRGASFQFIDPGGLEISNATLEGILEMAYDVREFQISGGPGWLDADRYYVSARSVARSSIPETRRKLQMLLAQRFHLAVHRELKTLPVYVLAAARSGSKLSESPSGDATSRIAAGIRATCGRMTGTRASMANLTAYLERQLRRPVRDQTDLSGRYDFQLEWMPEPGSCPAPSDDSTSSASLFSALQETLGLRLDATKSPVEVIVVDHADMPDPN